MAFVNNRDLDCCLFSFFVCGFSFSFSFLFGRDGSGSLISLKHGTIKKKNPTLIHLAYRIWWFLTKAIVEIKNVFELLVFHSPDAQQNGSKSFPLTLFRTFINYAAEWVYVWGICLCVLMEFDHHLKEQFCRKRGFCVAGLKALRPLMRYCWRSVNRWGGKYSAWFNQLTCYQAKVLRVSEPGVGCLINGLMNKPTGRRRQVASWDLRSALAWMKSWHYHVLSVTVDKSFDASEPRFLH